MASTINAAVGGLISSADASGELALQASGSTVATLTASGNVGIGTSSPSTKLHIKDSTGTAINLLRLETPYSNPSGNKSIIWTDATDTLGRISISYTAAGGSQMSFGSLYSGGYQTSDLMVLNSSGNLGIGTTSPAAKLDIRSGNLFFSSVSTTANTTLASIGVYQAGYPTTNQFASIDFLNGPSSWFSGSAIVFKTNGSADTTANAATEKMRLTGTGNLLVGTTTDVSGLTGVISDVNGNVRAIPQSGAAKTTSYTLVKGDVGEFINVGSGGSVVVPDSVFATGDVVSIFNNTSGNVTLTMSITTAYIGGTDADKATITLATRGIATILFVSGTVCVVNGNVS